jgi:predicted MFS family arabinose efflux permease
MVIPFMTMYTTQKLGFSIQQAGFIMSFFGVGSIIGAFIGGKITDKFGFHNVQILSLFGGGVMFIAVGFLTSFASLCTGVLILSVINDSFRPANSAAIAVYSRPENRTRSYSLNRLAINLGWAVGGTIGGFLAARSYHALFWVDGLTNIAAAVLLTIVLEDASKANKSIRSEHHKESIPDNSSAYKDGQYLAFIGLTILFSFCFFQMFTLLPLYYKTKLFISEDEIGMLMAVNGLVIAISEMILVYHLERRSKPYRNISYGVWLVAISYAVFNLFQGRFFLALFSILIITLGEMFAMPFMNTYWISRTNDNNRGQYAALYTMAWSTSQIAAPSIGGWIAGNYSFHHLFWVLFVVAVIAGLGYARLTSLPKHMVNPGVAN